MSNGIIIQLIQVFYPENTEPRSGPFPLFGSKRLKPLNNSLGSHLQLFAPSCFRLFYPLSICTMICNLCKDTLWNPVIFQVLTGRIVFWHHGHLRLLLPYWFLVNAILGSRFENVLYFNRVSRHFRLDTGSFWKILGRTYDQYRLDVMMLPQWYDLQAHSYEAAIFEEVNEWPGHELSFLSSNDAKSSWNWLSMYLISVTAIGGQKVYIIVE